MCLNYSRRDVRILMIVLVSRKQRYWNRTIQIEVEVRKGKSTFWGLSKSCRFHWLSFSPVTWPQDGGLLCSWSGWYQCPSPSKLHVLPVLGRHGHQRPPWASVQGIQVQQLLHGSAAAHPLPQPPAGCLHRHVTASLLWLWTLQVNP